MLIAIWIVLTFAFSEYIHEKIEINGSLISSTQEKTDCAEIERKLEGMRERLYNYCMPIMVKT